MSGKPGNFNRSQEILLMCPLFRGSGIAISIVLAKIIMIMVLLLKHQFSVVVCSFIKLY